MARSENDTEARKYVSEDTSYKFFFTNFTAKDFGRFQNYYTSIIKIKQENLKVQSLSIKKQIKF